MLHVIRHGTPYSASVACSHRLQRIAIRLTDPDLPAGFTVLIQLFLQPRPQNPRQVGPLGIRVTAENHSLISRYRCQDLMLDQVNTGTSGILTAHMRHLPCHQQICVFAFKDASPRSRADSDGHDGLRIIWQSELDCEASVQTIVPKASAPCSSCRFSFTARTASCAVMPCVSVMILPMPAPSKPFGTLSEACKGLEEAVIDAQGSTSLVG